MAVSGMHTITGQTNLGASQLNNAARGVYYIKGSIDVLLQRCKFYYVAEDSTPALDANMCSVIAGKAQTAWGRELRVIAMAYGYGNVEPATSTLNSSTPSRASSPSASATPMSSGLGFGEKEEAHLVFARGAALDRMNAAQRCERVGNVSVFARTSPKHKMAIVGAFQARGAVVAMTGDGGEYLPFFACLFYGSDARVGCSCCS